MIERLTLNRWWDWLESGSPSDSRLLHSSKSDRILVCPPHLGQGYIQEIVLEDDLSLVIEKYCPERDLIIDIPCHDSFVQFSFSLEGDDAGYGLFDVCFGLREIHIERSHQPIFNVNVVFTESAIVNYLQEFMARLSPQTLGIAEEVISSIYLKREGYLTSNTQEMLEKILLGKIDTDLDATLEQILSSTIYSEIQDINYERRHLFSATMKETIGKILSCPYQNATRRAYLKQKSLNLVTLYFEEAMTRSHLDKSDFDCIQEAGKILKSQSLNPPTTETLAKQAGTNRFKLNQGFHQIYSTTPFGYLRNYRLGQAKSLLMSSDLSVEEVAATVGYKSRSNFATAFRQRFGVNPKVLSDASKTQC